MIRDKSLVYLSLSAIAVIIALLWLFVGRSIVLYLVPEDQVATLYNFFSGVIFSLGFAAVYIFVRTILCLSEFMIEPDNLPTLMYRSVLEDDSEGIFFKDRKGRYRIINFTAQQILDLQNKNVIGRRDSELHSSILAHKIEREDKSILENGETTSWETVKNVGNGNDTFLCKKIPCRDRKGRIVGITGVCKNITVIRTFQNLNSELEDRYRRLFNKLPYPVLVLDTTTMLPFTFNNSMCELLHYTHEEFSRLRLSVHITNKDLEVFRNTVTFLMEHSAGEFEIQFKTKEKDIVDVSGYAQEVVIDEKKYLHMLLHDVTELKNSTNELISSELKYRSLFEYANDAIIIIGVETMNIIDANEIAVSLLGYSRDDLRFMCFMDLEDLADRAFSTEQMNNLEIYNHVLFEHKLRNRKGEKFHVEINAHKVNYGEDEVYQYVIRDISERKKTERALKDSEQRYRQMFESNQAIKLVINPVKNTIDDANPAAADFYGYTIDELKGMPLRQINVLSDDKLSELINSSKEQSLGFYSCPHRLANGDIRFVEVRDGRMEIDGQDLLYSIVHDVTVSKQAEDQLMLASKMFDCSTEAVMITDENKNVISVNHAFTSVTGYQQSEILGLAPEMILAGRNENLIHEEVVAEIEKHGQWKGEIWHRLKDGESRPINTTINMVKDNNAKVVNYVILMSPKYQDQQNSAQSNVHYTGLTSLPDRALFMDRLNNAVERAHRNEKSLAVLLIDFRNFSSINAEHGYDIGDSVLQAIAKRLKYNVRDSDTVAHFTSDDFAVLLEDLADIQQTGIVAQKIISTLQEDFQVENVDISLDVSIGISVAPDDATDAMVLLEKAEIALRNSQQQPGSNFQLTSSQLNENARLWLQTDEDLHRALKNNEFVLHYLPQMNVRDGVKFEALETLIRWRSSGQKMLRPIKFLPNAEQSGFISAIGFQVVDMAFSQYREWLVAGVNIGRLSLNICQTQIDEDLLDCLFRKCDEYQIRYDQIALDFNESKFITSTTEQKKILHKLQRHGFYICVDDFGSGSASLASLLQCPVDGIKIDKSLISKGHLNKDTEAMLKGLIALADRLDIDVIAEGVESEEQLQQLKAIGCEHIQGYYFSEPLPADQVAEFVKKH
ncbi:MAG: PAS domain S-box protein [Gammaproteobacteria bacterium]|nr:PAS domain S-box protein [Gammaproteobacteria bacterium]